MNKTLRRWIVRKLDKWVDKQIRKDHKALLDIKKAELTEMLQDGTDFDAIYLNGQEVGMLLRRMEAYCTENGEEFDYDEECSKFYNEAQEAK